VDNDCDGHVDFGAVDSLHLNWDGDSDGLGDPEVAREYCEHEPGWVDNADDCDDADFLVGPGEVFYFDSRDEGCGDPESAMRSCEPPPHYVELVCEGEEGATPSMAQIAELDPDGGSDIAYDADGNVYISSVTDNVDGVWRIAVDGSVEVWNGSTAHNIDAFTLSDDGVLAAITGVGLGRLGSEGASLIWAFDTPKGENWHNAHHNRFASSIAWDTVDQCTWVPNVDGVGRVACLDAGGEKRIWELGAYIESVALDAEGVLWVSSGPRIASEDGRSYELPSNVLDMVWTDEGLVVETAGHTLVLCDEVCDELGATTQQAKLAAHPDGGVVRMRSNPVKDAEYERW
jgi:hypothetical protein